MSRNLKDQYTPQPLEDEHGSDAAANVRLPNGTNGGLEGAPPHGPATSQDQADGHTGGEAHLLLDCEEVSLAGMPDSLHVRLVISGTIAGTTVQPIMLALPSTIAQARALGPHAWNSAARDAVSQFDPVLTADQRDTIWALCYVHRWFCQAPLDADYRMAWDEMRDCLRTSIAMGRYILATPGEDLVANVALWARFRIRNTYPADCNLFGMFDPSDSESEGEGEPGDV